LPNHYLDLDRWQPVRHWPGGPIARVGDTDAEAVDALVCTIVAAVARTLRGVAAVHRCYVGLTAGRDSRMVLAAARDLPGTTFVTFAYEDEARRGDLEVARAIAGRLALDHLAVPLRDPTESERARYLWRIGHCGHSAKAGTFDGACRRHLDPRRAWITGFGGEVGRGFYWRAGDQPEGGLSPEGALARMGLPADAETRAQVRAWLQEVPHQDLVDLLDLLYLEQRMGCWAGPHMYGTAPFRANLTPFCHRQVIAAMMALPVAFRRWQGLPDWIAARALPELRQLPYQRLAASG
jgi:hypothetical protein